MGRSCKWSAVFAQSSAFTSAIGDDLTASIAQIHFCADEAMILQQLKSGQFETRRKKIEAALRSKTTKGIQPCTVCGNNDWVLDNTVYELREFHGGNLAIGQSGIVPNPSHMALERGKMSASENTYSEIYRPSSTVRLHLKAR